MFPIVIHHNSLVLTWDMQVYPEGTHLMIPWFERPIIYDVRARPHLVESTSGSRDLQMVILFSSSCLENVLIILFMMCFGYVRNSCKFQTLLSALISYCFVFCNIHIWDILFIIVTFSFCMYFLS